MFMYSAVLKGFTLFVCVCAGVVVPGFGATGPVFFLAGQAAEATLPVAEAASCRRGRGAQHVHEPMVRDSVYLDRCVRPRYLS